MVLFDLCVVNFDFYGGVGLLVVVVVDCFGDLVCIILVELDVCVIDYVVENFVEWLGVFVVMGCVEYWVCMFFDVLVGECLCFVSGIVVLDLFWVGVG